MSTSTQTLTKPVASASVAQSCRPGEAIGPKAKAAKQPMVLETADVGPFGAEFSRLQSSETRYRSVLNADF